MQVKSCLDKDDKDNMSITKGANCLSYADRRSY